MKLEVKVKNIHYTDSKTSYRIFKGQVLSYELSPEEEKHQMVMQRNMTFKGNMTYCAQGDTYIINAKLKRDKSGLVLYIENAFLKRIELESELELYLKRHVPRVGPATAKKIVDTLKVNAVDIIKSEEGEERLIEIVKSKKLAKRIREHILDNANIFTIMEFLQMHNLDVKIAGKILKEYGKEGLLDLQHDPYFFIRCISFKELDAIASKSNYITEKDIKRIGAGVVAIVNDKAKNNGDVYTHIDTIYSELESYINTNGAFKPIKLTQEEITEAIKYTVEYEKLVLEEGEYLYIRYLRNKENDVAYNVKRLNKPNRSLSTQEIEEHIKEFERTNKVKASKEQKEAVIKALQNDFSVLTGLPGAGKTFTINMILSIYMKINPEAVVKPLAPTGKASRRISEMTGIPAETVHRALKMNEHSDKATKIQADFIVIDEASMLDIYIAGTLLSNIENGTKVLVVGDIEQLPSVKAGLVLRDIIDSGIVPVTRLTKLFRQAEDSNIVKNAHAIAHETFDFDWSGDSIFWKAKDATEAEMNFIAGYKRLLDKGSSRQSLGILTPQKEGELGTIRMNKIIQEKFNRNAKFVVVNKTGDKIKEGDLVMQTVNNYDIEVFNGEVGIVERIDYQRDEFGDFVLDADNNKKQVICVKYPHKEEPVIYDDELYNELDLAYCITIHKSQGSEYDAVMTIVDKSHEMMLNKNLIYTAWTRAKKFLVVIGDEATLNNAVKKKDATSRLSNLKQRLQGKQFNRLVDLKVPKQEEKLTYTDYTGKVYEFNLSEALEIADGEVF